MARLTSNINKAKHKLKVISVKPKRKQLQVTVEKTQQGWSFEIQACGELAQQHNSRILSRRIF